LFKFCQFIREWIGFRELSALDKFSSMDPGFVDPFGCNFILQLISKVYKTPSVAFIKGRKSKKDGTVLRAISGKEAQVKEIHRKVR